MTRKSGEIFSYEIHSGSDYCNIVLILIIHYYFLIIISVLWLKTTYGSASVRDLAQYTYTSRTLLTNVRGRPASRASAAHPRAAYRLSKVVKSSSGTGSVNTAYI